MRKLRLNLSHFHPKDLAGLTALCCLFSDLFPLLISWQLHDSTYFIKPTFRDTEFLLKIPRFLPDSTPQQSTRSQRVTCPKSSAWASSHKHCSQPKAFTLLLSPAKWRKPHFHYNPEAEIFTPGPAALHTRLRNLHHLIFALRPRYSALGAR